METKLTGMWQYRRRLGMALLIGMTVVSTMAWAGPQPIAPGQTLYENDAPSGGFSFSYPNPPPTPLYNLQDQAFNSFSNVSSSAGGDWNEVVIKDPTTGDLDFFIQFTLGTTTGGAVDQNLALAAFSSLYTYGQSVGADVTLTPTMEPPGTTPSGNPYPLSYTNVGGTGDDFAWVVAGAPSGDNGTNTFVSDDTSVYLGIYTNVTHATLGSLTLSGGSGSSAFSESTDDIYVPIPEPVTLLFGLAIVCVIGVHLIRRTNLQSLWPAGRSLTV